MRTNNPTVLSEIMSKFLRELCFCYQNVASFVHSTDSRRLGDRIRARALGANTIYMYRSDILSCFVSNCCFVAKIREFVCIFVLNI